MVTQRSLCSSTKAIDVGGTILNAILGERRQEETAGRYRPQWSRELFDYIVYLASLRADAHIVGMTTAPQI